MNPGERGGSGVECRTPEREVRGSRPTSAVLCPWARHFTPRKYWLITQEAMAPSRHDWKIVDWDVKPQHNQPTMWTKCIWWNLCLKFGFHWHNGRDSDWKWLMQGSLLYDNITGCVARPTVGCWLVKKISTLIGYLLTDGLNYLTVKYLAGWHFEKRAAVLKHFISSIFSLLCIALWHYVREHIIYTVYSDCVLVFAFAFLSCKKKKNCFKQDFLPWIIQKLVNIYQHFKE